MGEDFQGFIDAVQSRSGCRDRAGLERATRGALGVLGSHLHGVPPTLHGAIPRDLRSGIEAGLDHPAVGPAAFYLMISNEIGMRIGMALEVTHAVVNELASRLDEGSRLRLKSLLPPAWAALLRTTTSSRVEPQPTSMTPRWSAAQTRSHVG